MSDDQTPTVTRVQIGDTRTETVKAKPGLYRSADDSIMEVHTLVNLVRVTQLDCTCLNHPSCPCSTCNPEWRILGWRTPEDEVRRKLDLEFTQKQQRLAREQARKMIAAAYGDGEQSEGVIIELSWSRQIWAWFHRHVLRRPVRVLPHARVVKQLAKNADNGTSG